MDSWAKNNSRVKIVITKKNANVREKYNLIIEQENL